MFSVFTTIRPPNSYNMQRWHGGGGVLSASSYHQGGAHILMADGAVVFITDSIEAGDVHEGNVWRDGTGASTAGSQSPYGIWGAFGNKGSLRDDRRNVLNPLTGGFP